MEGQAVGQDELKRAAGEAAVRHIEPLLTRDAVVGVGTGSTANCFIHALTRVRDRFAATVASSEASARLLRELGFPVLDLNEAPELAVYVDGADEADRWLQLVKGGGGALTREKILASATAVFVCIADESKLVDRLGRFPLPVEVIPMAVELVSRRLARLPCRPRLRPDFVTDNGNRILDLLDLEIDDAPRLEREPNDIPGIVTNGLFALRPADRLLLAGASGITELARA